MNNDGQRRSPSQPCDEPVTSHSNLRWQDVTLPAAVSEHQLDAIIDTVLTLRRQKTALVIGKALSICGEHGLPVPDEILGARMQALAEPRASKAPAISGPGAMVK